MPRVIGYDISITGDVLYGPYTILDGQASAQNLVSFVAASAKNLELAYSIERNGVIRTGLLIISNNGVSASAVEINGELADMGIILDAIISGSNVWVTYTSSSTGFNGNFKFYKKSWT